MIYKCKGLDCGFLFERIGEVECCPDCGSKEICLADETEQKEYLERKKRQTEDKE